jgi:hypothetical protein
MHLSWRADGNSPMLARPISTQCEHPPLASNPVNPVNPVNSSPRPDCLQIRPQFIGANPPVMVFSCLEQVPA